ncbi:MAG TPA: PRC-barrel domain-containing protein [Azospirillum sp.]|nr:PRC-barrel domain-containing protein [Azospirillum sp.]
MHLRIFAATSLVAILAGGAWAQDAGTPAQPVPPQQTAPGQMDTQGTPATPAAKPAPSAASGTEVSAEEMIGRSVYGKDNQEIGSVTDIVVDPQTKQIRKLVVGSGGFLGIGKKTVALEMDQVEIRPEQGLYASNLTREEIKGMPEFKVDESTVSLRKPPPPTQGPAGAPGTGSPSMLPPSGTTGSTPRQ